MNFNNFIKILEEIRELCENNNLLTSQCDIILTQARFESSLLQFDKALETLTFGLEIAKKAELNKHIRFFTKELNIVNEKMNYITVFTEINSAMDLEGLKNYLFSIRQMINRDSS